MPDVTLLLPLIIIFAAALVAALWGRPSLNRRLTTTQMSWLLALAPFSAFLLLLTRIGALNAGETFAWWWNWLPDYGLRLGLYLDSLGTLFALLVTFIGTLVVVYTGQYFKGDQGAWRFLLYLLLFMGSMLGLVMAADIITLFIFWEGTSIVSFLLVAYKYKYEDARRGAFKALLITGGGGIALLAGLLFASSVAGSTEFTTILASGDALRSSDLYLVMLGLVAFGAFTKSAQFPAHIWLPQAMSAPTPASAYLHSATMVKAGIYLMARLNPALGFTDAWFWLLTLVGGATMLVGAYLGLKQNDLKALLAYSTISQLGVLMMLIGQDVSEAFKALVIGVLAHALYKSALFLVAGIVDHEAGTRDLRRLGGLRRMMPYTFVVGAVAALSMAGLPPLFGFLAKETLLAAAVHPSLPPLISIILPGASVVAGALMLAQAGLFVWGTFLGKPQNPEVHAHEAPWPMFLAPAVPALLSLAVGLLPEPQQEAVFLANAAGDAYGDSVKVSLALWTGLNVPLLLSIVAITLGSAIFFFRRPVRAWQMRIAPRLSFNAVYDWLLRGIDAAAALSTRVQQGRLRLYLSVMITAVVVLVVGLSGATLLPPLGELSLPAVDFTGEVVVLRLFALLVTVGAALASVVLRRDFNAILALGASGLSIAVLLLLEPAPDVALVQIVVDILALVILVLALTRLPRAQRRKAQDVTYRTRNNRRLILRDVIIAGGIGLVVTAITLGALLARPHPSFPTPYYEANAKTLTGAKDIVGAIVVDFRALDTLIEITVFSMAGLGIYTLLRYAARKHKDGALAHDVSYTPIQRLLSRGIGGELTSAFVRVPAYVTLPIALVLGATHMMYGHDQPGDGFTAGVIISLAVALWYVAFGYEETRRRLPWLRATPLIAGGILLVVVSGIVATAVNGSFLSPVNFGEMIGLPLPEGFYISTSFFFEVAICLAVLGSVSHMLNTLGHPGDNNGNEGTATADGETAVATSAPAQPVAAGDGRAQTEQTRERR